MKRNKNKLPITAIYTLVAILICSVSVGFAAMSSTLSISGIASVSADGVIKITNVRLYEELNGAAEAVTATYSNLLMNVEFDLPNTTSQITYEVTIENQTKTNQMYDGFTIIRLDAVGVTGYEIGIAEGEVINVGDSKTFIVTMFYGEDSMPSSVSTILLDVLFLFSPTNSVNLVTQDSLLLSLNGADKIYNNTWYDRSQHQNVALENVTSNLNTNAYSFSGTNSCALTNRTVIPTTGDFTVETLITTGSSVSGDKAILAQKTPASAGTDTGRTKPFNIFTESGIPNIRLFLIGSVGNRTVTPNYVTGISANTTYHLTLTKAGTTLTLYVNGYAVQTVLLNANDVLSVGTTQIGCYESVSSQNYIGDIHAVRIYERALTNDEILSNFLSQKVAEDISGTLASYIINNQIVTSGDGLYYVPEKDAYVYKGTNPNNNMFLGGSHYRILSVQSDNTLKVVKVGDIFSEVPFDSSGHRTTAENPYCTMASTIASENLYYGCNVWGTHTNILGNESNYTIKNSSIIDFLNTEIYNTLDTDTKNRIIEKDFKVGLIISNNLSAIRTEENALTWRGKIGTITVTDIMDAGDSTYITASYSNNYIAKISHSNLYLWTMNGKSNNTFDVWTLINGSTISQRRASRTHQVVSTSQTAYFGVLPVFYIDGNLEASGDGTIDTPFAFK